MLMSNNEIIIGLMIMIMFSNFLIAHHLEKLRQMIGKEI